MPREISGHEGGPDIPFVNVKLTEGVFTPEQKQRIVRDLTDALVAWASIGLLSPAFLAAIQ